MHRYLVYYKTQIQRFYSNSYPESVYCNYTSMVMLGNSAGEVYDEFNRQNAPKDDGCSLDVPFTQVLTISDLGEYIKDEPTESVKDKTEKTVDDWVKELEG